MSDELPGFSVFTKDEAGQIFHTYSVFARGTEDVGRSTASSTSRPRAATSRPAATCPHWVRHHDKYEEKPGNSCCHG